MECIGIRQSKRIGVKILGRREGIRREFVRNWWGQENRIIVVKSLN